MTSQVPLILTLQIDYRSFTFFNELRKKNFPAKINYLDAHLTLFHHLPDIPAVIEVLEYVAAKQEIISLEVSNVIKLGRGVAYQIKSNELMRLQDHFKQQWKEWLTPQDRQGFRPHITVQNKVEVETANILFNELNSSFQPFTAKGTGLSLWEYQGGPWNKRKDFPFANLLFS